jgi:hypothetical protein
VHAYLEGHNLLTYHDHGFVFALKDQYLPIRFVCRLIRVTCLGALWTDMSYSHVGLTINCKHVDVIFGDEDGVGLVADAPSVSLSEPGSEANKKTEQEFGFDQLG